MGSSGLRPVLAITWEKKREVGLSLRPGELISVSFFPFLTASSILQNGHPKKNTPQNWSAPPTPNFTGIETWLLPPSPLRTLFLRFWSFLGFSDQLQPKGKEKDANPASTRLCPCHPQGPALAGCFPSFPHLLASAQKRGVIIPVPPKVPCRVSSKTGKVKK